MLMTWAQRGIAATAGAFTAYNIGVDGWEDGLRDANEEIAKRDTDLFVKSQTSNIHSHLLEDAKAVVRQAKLDNRLYPFIVKTKHIAAQLVKETISSAVNIAGVAAVLVPAFMKTKNPIAKKFIPAAGTVILLVNNGITLLSDVLGVGKKGL